MARRYSGGAYSNVGAWCNGIRIAIQGLNGLGHGFTAHHVFKDSYPYVEEVQKILNKMPQGLFPTAPCRAQMTP